MSERVGLRVKVGFGLLAYFTAEGLLLFGYKYLDVLTRADDVPLLEPLIEEMTGSYGAGVVFALLLYATARFRLRRDSWLSRLPLYLCWMILASILHTTLNALGRRVLFPLAGLGPYDYGVLALRVPMEFLNDVLWFWTYVALLHLFYHYKESRDRELQTALVETELVRAQLATLRTQLQPHFLFNTLNTISSRMYEDPPGADRMMSQLGDLLRITLESSTTQEVPLEEELAILGSYLEIMEARFEEELRVTVDVEEGCQGAMVPTMVLQPLAENAIRHGVSRHPGSGRIEVRIKKVGGTLSMEIKDDGPGISGDPETVRGRGVGLRNTRERLRLLYGDAQALTVANRDEGGLGVTMTIPFRIREEEAAHGDGT